MTENRYALLIAGWEYDDSYFRPLEAPAQDVEALSCVLRDPAMGAFCDVKILRNEPRDKVILAIEDFLDNRNREDLLLLYFSGHGIKDEDGRLYYATRNTLHKRLVASAVTAYQVNDLIGKSRSRSKILILDCCYSGAFARASLAKGDPAVGVMEEFKQGQGLVTLTASDAFQYSFESEETITGDPSSVFTRALVEGIATGEADKDGDQLISLDELYHYTYERVRAVKPNQTPRRSGDIEGEIFIARNPRPARPAGLPPKVREALENPIAEIREAVIKTLDAFLRGRNKSLSLAAREALLKLIEDDSRRVARAAKEAIDRFAGGGVAEERPAPQRQVTERPDIEKERPEREQFEQQPQRRREQPEAERPTTGLPLRNIAIERRPVRAIVSMAVLTLIVLVVGGVIGSGLADSEDGDVRDAAAAIGVLLVSIIGLVVIVRTGRWLWRSARSARKPRLKRFLTIVWILTLVQVFLGIGMGVASGLTSSLSDERRFTAAAVVWIIGLAIVIRTGRRIWRGC